MRLSEKANKIMAILPPANPKRSHYMDTNRIIEAIAPNCSNSGKGSIRRTLRNLERNKHITSFPGYRRLRYYAKKP